MGGGPLIVLDTHTAIWYAAGIKIRASAHAAIEAALASSGAIISAISAWEIGMLIRKGRFTPPVHGDEYLRRLFGADGVLEGMVSAEIAARAAALPGDFHGDPADRIIVATAAAHGVPLATRDKAIVAYLRATKLVPAILC